MKKFLAVFVILAVCVTFCSCQKSDNSADTTTATTQNAYPDLSSETSEETIANAKKAYLAYIAPFSGEEETEDGGITSALVVDLDKNKVPEVIFTYYGDHNMYILSYGENSGLNVISPALHSSAPAQVYFSEDDAILYYTDSGHNQGTSWIHEGVCLKATSEGFETTGTVSGDTWDDISADVWQDDELFSKTDDKYDKAFEISMNKLIGNGVYVDYFDACERENTEKYLEEKLGINLAAKRAECSAFKETAISAIGTEPLAIRIDDYDRNGTYEAFALVGKELDEDSALYEGKVWFVSDKGKAEPVYDNFGYWSDGEILECQYNCYYQIQLASGSSSPSAVWKVSGDKCEEITVFNENCVETFTTFSLNAHSNSLVASVDGFDASLENIDKIDSGVGHTHKPYFYYDTPDGIKEYGGVEITKAQLIALGGGAYIDLAENEGYTVKNIFIRKNGIINVNIYKYDGEAFYDCRYINLKVMNNGVSALSYDLFAMEIPEDIEDIAFSGIYMAASVPELATYPDKEAFASSSDNNKTAETEEIKTAYRKLLEDIHSNPQKYYDAGEWGVEDNFFAIADITDDGVPELLVSFESTYMAAMKMNVWTYENGKTSLFMECGVEDTFYEGGYIKSEAYHNHTKGETIWPFTIDKYDLESGKIDSDFYSFYCRDKGYMDSEDDPFPVADDKDKDGVIYFIEDLSDENPEGKASTKSEYEAFINKYIPEKNKIDIEYSELTAENIAKVK